jgi:hypothetical protein
LHIKIRPRGCGARRGFGGPDLSPLSSAVNKGW